MDRERRVPASEFKQHCLRIIERVSKTKSPIVVTRHGRPVVKIVPASSDASECPIGSVRLLSDRPEDYYSTGER